ncbi:hypothetical protein D3C76_282240 [compost metagenome]
MINIKNYISDNVPSNKISSRLIEAIEKMGYTLPIDEAINEFQKKLGLPSVENSVPNKRQFFEIQYMKNRLRENSGDIWNSFFRFGNNNYCILKVIEKSEEDTRKSKTDKCSIDLCFIILDDNIAEIEMILEKFKTNISAIKQWKEYKKISETFNELSKSYSAPVFTSKDYLIAKSLYEPELLNILMSIKSSGGLLRRDALAKFDKITDSSKHFLELIKLNLLKSEYVVLCKKTSEQINKAPSKESINLMGEHGIKCSRCNRLITDETIEEYLTATEIANEMLDGSKWMTINLVETLLNLGITEEDILVNITQGPEEIDAIVSIGDEIVLFELKDSQFSLGHAYAFQSRLGLYEAETGVIWASKGVAPEVKEHFNKVKPDAEICYIESNESLWPLLLKIIEELRWGILERELSSLAITGIVISNIPGGIIEDIKEKSKQMQNINYEEVAASAQT